MNKKYLVVSFLFFIFLNFSTIKQVEAKQINIYEVNLNPSDGQVSNVIVLNTKSSSSAIINSREVFKAYRGQCTIYLTLKNVKEQMFL